jgi:hypothetical protein
MMELIELKRFVLELAPFSYPTALDQAALAAHMLWPHDRDEEQRSILIDRLTVECLRGAFSELSEVDKGDLFACADRAPGLTAIHAAAKPAFRSGYVAGIVLHNVLTSGTSTGAAITKVVKSLPAAMRLSASTFNNSIWPEFRPVAHLWAAYCTKAPFHNCHDFPCTLPGLRSFLWLAEYYRLSGESTSPKQSSKGPILRPGDALIVRMPGDSPMALWI